MSGEFMAYLNGSKEWRPSPNYYTAIVRRLVDNILYLISIFRMFSKISTNDCLWLVVKVVANTRLYPFQPMRVWIN